MFNIPLTVKNTNVIIGNVLGEVYFTNLGYNTKLELGYSNNNERKA
jgi:hypothetical protein